MKLEAILPLWGMVVHRSTLKGTDYFKGSAFRYYLGFNSREELYTIFVDLLDHGYRHIVVKDPCDEGGINKYKTPYSLEKSIGTLLEPEEYFYQMRYIALCLSGQLDPKIDESYCMEVYDGTEIDWEKFFTTLPTTKEKIRKRLISCLKNIFGDSKGLK